MVRTIDLLRETANERPGPAYGLTDLLIATAALLDEARS
jgi:hypothetical protein